MKAVVHDHYGPPDVLRVENVPAPVPKADEILVRVRATTVNRLDCATREANRRSGWTMVVISHLIFGIRRPRRRILGSELAGEVEAVGVAVREFAPDDRVFGTSGMRFGAHAELMCVPEGAKIALMPPGLAFEDAAPVCDGAQYAVNCLRAARVGLGTSLLVYGASGAIGTAGVQLAKHLGAHVTAVCGTASVDLVRSLGADEVIDYTQQDFTAAGITYDVVFDAVGKQTFKRCKGSLKPHGVFVTTDGLRNVPLSWWTRMQRRRVLFPVRGFTREDVVLLRQLIEAGSFRAVIDRRYPLEQVVEATRYVEAGQKTGNVVLTVGGATS